MFKRGAHSRVTAAQKVSLEQQKLLLNNAIESDEKGLYRDAFIGYMQSIARINAFLNNNEVSKSLVETMVKKRTDAKRRMGEIKDLARKEVLAVHNKNMNRRKEQKTSRHCYSLQEIITVTDEYLFVLPDKLPELKLEVTDYRLPNSKPPERTFERMTKVPLAPRKKPLMPAVMREDFKEAMSEPQVWNRFKKCVHTTSPGIYWSDVIGYTAIKDLLDTEVVFACNMPSLAQKGPNIYTLERTNACLMYGPPGTGKTQLALALATEADSNAFIQVSSSDILDKYYGETEKKLNMLFEMAKALKPSIVFIDEAENLFSDRNTVKSELSANVTSSLLQHMSACKDVFVIASTNAPWKLDEAFIRRFQLSLHVGMPTLQERMIMIKYQLKSTPAYLKAEDYLNLARHTAGYTGSDINLVQRCINSHQRDSIKYATHFKLCPMTGATCIPCSPNDPDPTKVQCQFTDMTEEKVMSAPLNYEQVLALFKKYGRVTVTDDTIEKMKEYERDNVKFRSKKPEPQVHIHKHENLPTNSSAFFKN